MGLSQHYVPKFYLRRFSIEGTDGKSVFVINKELWKIEKKSISNIAKEDNFYESEIDHLIKDGKSTGMEGVLGKWETEYADLLRQVESSLLKGNSLDPTTVERLSRHLLLQYIRTKGFRERMDWDLGDDAELSTKALHSIALTQPEIWEEFAGQINSRRFVMAKAARGFYFVTSDNPLVIQPSVTYDANDIRGSISRFASYMEGGFNRNTKGMDFFLPLSRSTALIAVDETSSHIKLMRNQTVVTLTSDLNQKLLASTAASATKYIFGVRSSPDLTELISAAQAQERWSSENQQLKETVIQAVQDARKE